MGFDDAAEILVTASLAAHMSGQDRSGRDGPFKVELRGVLSYTQSGLAAATPSSSQLVVNPSKPGGRGSLDAKLPNSIQKHGE